MWNLRSGVDARMRAVFFRSLTTMFNSGVPLVAALDMLSKQQEHPDLGEACLGLSKKLQEGHYLSRAMQSYPSLFKPLHQKMILSGERSGQLGAVLLRLAEREEGNDRLTRKLKTSLTMPLIVSAFCIALALLAPPLLFKGLFQMIAEVGGSIPWTTRIMMGLSWFFTSPYFFVLAGVLGFLGFRGWQRLREDPDWQFALLKVPQLGGSLRLLFVTDFTQNLRCMLDVGMPMLQALELSARATDLRCLEVIVGRVGELVKEGEALSDALAGANFFPATLIQGVRASEEAGRLPRMLENLESIFRVELEQRLEMLTRALEPLVLAVIGLIVGFTLIATLQPLLSVLDQL